MNPKHPLYIVSKGRADSRLTSKALERMGVPYFIVVEEQERDMYAAVIDPKKVLVLDKKYQREYNTCDDLGDTKGKGPGAARNFAWDHSISMGAKWHWVMDDNIKWFFRYNRNVQARVKTGAIFRAMEDFCERYTNVLMAGPNYYMFVPRKKNVPPFVANTRIYSCVEPKTPILCADLVWRQAGSILPGQRIVAFDAESEFKGQGVISRAFRTAVVERNELSSSPSFIVTTDIGVPVQASDDHPWLVRRNLKRSRRYKGHAKDTDSVRWKLTWVKTVDLKVGDQIAHLSRPWIRDETHEGGWVSGMFDGEGCFSVRASNYAIALTIAQKPGPVMERLKTALSERGYTFHTVSHKSGCDSIRLGGGFLGALRFAGEFAPTRLIARASLLWEDRGVRLGQSYEWATVTGIENVGDKPVSQITTSTGTFVTGGYLTHNCNLIRNDAPYRWRGRYNEDTDLSLQMLKDGFCTIQFNAFLQEKATTQTIKGGNTAEFYAKEGTFMKSKMQVDLHPDVSRMVERFGRIHHFVDYTPFKKNKLILRKDLEIPKEVDNYGMELVVRPEV